MGLLGAESAFAAVGNIAVTMDSREHALPGLGSDDVGPVERAGNRCDAEIQFVGELGERHCYRVGEITIPRIAGIVRGSGI